MPHEVVPRDRPGRSPVVVPWCEEADMAGTTANHPREPEAVERAARRRMKFSPWNVLLLIPLVATLLPTIYNKTGPELAGWPFFYWYQMVAIPGSVLITLLVYRATRGER
jgi:hypothetical protein